MKTLSAGVRTQASRFTNQRTTNQVNHSMVVFVIIMGGFHSDTIFDWKFRKFLMERLFFQSFQTCNLIGRSKNVRDGATKRQQNGNGNFVQIEREFTFQKKWSTSNDVPFVPKNFRLIRAYHLHFNRLNRTKWRVPDETGCVPWKLTSFIYLRAITEESEAASKQVLAKAEQIRKFQEENKYLGQLVSHADELFCKP